MTKFGVKYKTEMTETKTWTTISIFDQESETKSELNLRVEKNGFWSAKIKKNPNTWTTPEPMHIMSVTKY